MSQPVPDSTFVTEVAALVHPECTVKDVYRKKVVVIGGQKYDYDDPSAPRPDTLNLTTLQGVVDYIQSGKIEHEAPIIHVESPSVVNIVSPSFGGLRERLVFAKSSPYLPKITVDEYMQLEEFKVMLQYGFVANDDRILLQETIGKVGLGLAAEIKDDGVSQGVATKSGLTRVETSVVNNTYNLIPFRTFSEIIPPVCAFILRLKAEKVGDGYNVRAALFEADGGAWRPKAVESIGKFLRSKLEDGVILA